MRDFLMTGLAALLVIKAADKWLLPSVPDQTVVTVPVLGPITSDDLATAGALAVAAPMVESTLRGWF